MEQITKAAIRYDSGWVDITDKAGQYFNITHNLNSTDIIVDITGRTTKDGGVHQRHLGGTGYTLGWRRRYGKSGLINEIGNSLVQTSDGGYAIAGSTDSFGAGYTDFWWIKTDVSGNMQWNKTYGGADLDDGRSMIQINDGGYALAGGSMSFGSGGYDLWLVKTDSSGNACPGFEYGLAWTDSTADTITCTEAQPTPIGTTSASASGKSKKPHNPFLY